MTYIKPDIVFDMKANAAKNIYDKYGDDRPMILYAGTFKLWHGKNQTFGSVSVSQHHDRSHQQDKPL